METKTLMKKMTFGDLMDLREKEGLDHLEKWSFIMRTPVGQGSYKPNGQKERAVVWRIPCTMMSAETNLYTTDEEIASTLIKLDHRRRPIIEVSCEVVRLPNYFFHPIIITKLLSSFELDGFEME